MNATVIIMAVIGVICLVLGILAKAGVLARMGVYANTRVIDVDSYGSSVGNILLVIAVLSVAAAVLTKISTKTGLQIAVNALLFAALIIAAVLMRRAEKRCSATTVAPPSFSQNEWK